MILTIYDISGIQSFIFATNKLKEIIGASIIVNKILHREIPRLFGEAEDDWAENEFTFDSHDKTKTIYIGGGNALVMYDSPETERNMTRKLQERFFHLAGGGIRLCSASIEADLSLTLKENQARLMPILAENKYRTSNPLAARGISINAHDNQTFEPLLLFDKVYSSHTTYCKLNAYKEGHKTAFSELMPDNRKLIFVKDIDFYKKEDKEKFLAVIHIDGNTMGIRIREFVDKLKGNLIDDLNQLKTLSAEINGKFKNALSKTISELYSNTDNDEILFRPIIADGDDITVICAGSDAFNVVSTFIRNLEAENLTDNMAFTVGAGIAFVKFGYPFYDAYEIAEQCCKNAKVKTLSREQQYKSSIDFQICYSGITTDISHYRARYFTFINNKEKYNLLLRPYTFNGSQPEFSFTSFTNLQNEIYGNITRTKLKTLRNEYGKGVLSARTYCDFLLGRAKDEEEKQLLKKIGDPFIEYEGEYYAKLFDILDIMDIMKEGDFD